MRPELPHSIAEYGRRELVAPGKGGHTHIPSRTMPTIELITHMDAGDRRLWTGDQDSRPLSELGRRQAAHITKALAVSPFDGLYSSPALRCRQTLEPLAAQLHLPITVVPELRESNGFQPPVGWAFQKSDAMHDPLGGAYAAGRAWAALQQMIGASSGRVAVCSHGDIVPALVAFLIGAFGLSLPAPHNRRGGWYTLRFDRDRVSALQHDVLPNFPH
jgi:8-oxo-dGTP diphosphatase